MTSRPSKAASSRSVSVSFGQERLSYDLLAGTDRVNRLTGGLEWLQQLGNGYQIKAAADTYASQNRYTLGVDRSLAGSDGRHNLGVSLVGLRGRDGLGDDNQFKLTYTYVFGAGSGNRASMALGARAKAAPEQSAAWSGSSLLDQVAQRPSFIPSHVVAKIDHTALPTRLIAVDKTALPAGASVNALTGDVSAPLGIVVTGIAGVTKNLAVFANSGQFSLSGNSLVIKPSLIVQPAVGVVDSYVVTVNNFGGGTTLITVLVSHGSVKIDSITVTAGVAADVTAPTTTVVPAVSGITDTGATLSATINEAGTGYYLVLPSAAAAPSVAAVQAGTAFAMSANVAATPTISGLTAVTAYKVWFVAKDAANNVQAAVQNVALTTSAPADLSAPTTTVAPAVSALTATGATLSVTINEAGTGYYLVLPAAAAAPSVAAVQAGTAFAMSANVAATPTISGLSAVTAYKVWFVAKDAANNVQATVQSVALTTTAAPDVTAPVTSTAPSIAVAATDTTAGVTQTINENGTGYYLVLPAAAAAPSVAAVLAGTSLAMTGGVAAPVSLTGLSASTAYKYYFVAKDSANNTQAAVSVGLAITTAAVVPPEVVPVMGDVPNQVGTVGTAFSLAVTPSVTLTNGDAILSYAVASGTLPAGLTLNTTTGVISGTPTTAGTYNITITATDNDGASNADAVQFVVSAAVPPEVVPVMGDVPNQVGTVGTAFSLAVAPSVTLTNGDAILSYAVASGTLPTGLTLNTATGVISGTPTTAGTYNITITATDNDGASNADAVQFVVSAAPDTTPPTVPATLTLTGNAGASAGYTNTQTLALAVAAATEAGELWYVSESSSAPAGAAAGWSSTQPTSFTLSAGDGAKSVYVYVKDNVGNVQATGKTAAIALDTALPTIAARASWGAGAASGATIAGRSVTFNDTAGGTAQSVAVTASSGSIANLVAGAFGAATTFDFVAPANNSAAAVNVTITYSVTDKSGNVTSTTDTVSVGDHRADAQCGHSVVDQRIDICGDICGRRLVWNRLRQHHHVYP